MCNLQTFAAEAQAVPQQVKMQAAIAAGPVSTAGVLLRLNSTMRERKMAMELRPKIFITSSCQLTELVKNCNMKSIMMTF